MSAIRLGMRLPTCRPVRELAEAAALVESVGLDGAWFPDSQLLWRDPFAAIAAAGAVTSRISLGTAVTNVETRHPSVVASAARTAGESAPGRFTLGLGVGHSALAPIAVPATTRAAMRERLATVRSLLDGADVDFGAGPFHLRDAGGVERIALAANGPRNLAFAGEVADAAILLSGVSSAAVEHSIGLVRTGAAEAGRDADDVTIIVSAFCGITDDIERDSRVLKPICAGIAQNGGAAFLALAGIEVDVPAKVPELYPDLVHAEDWGRAVEVCSAWISDADALAFAESFCLFGTPDEVAAKIGVVAGLGVGELLLQHVGSYDLPLALIERLGTEVRPLLAP